MIPINLTSKICANHLTVQKDEEEYTIADPETFESPLKVF